jgi:ubiquinone/menaquinone biosynthesis C-methylase UbiE
LDVPSSRISEAQNKNVYNHIVTYDGDRIPLKDGSVQTVISNCVFEHLPNLDNNIAEISRVLKPGGFLLTSVMTDAWNDYLIGKYVFGTAYIKKFELQQEHINLLSQNDWESRLKKHGLLPIKSDGYLNQTTSRLLELAHLFSVPSLISRKILNRWVLYPKWHQPLQLTKLLRKLLLKSLSTKPRESAALFIVAQKE